MRIQAPGKLAALTARGPAGEGLQETQKQTHVFNCMPAVDNHTLNDEIVLRAVDPAQAYHVAGYINGVAINFMVDTGASVSLLHADIWRRLTADCNLVLEAWHRKLIGVEGSPLSVLGTANLGVGLGGITVQSDFLVAAGLSSDAIIGLDFLEKHEAVINLGQGVLHLKGRAIPLLKTSPNCVLNANSTSINLRINETIELPAMSGIDIIVHVPAFNTRKQDWLVEATQQETSFIVANAVVTPWEFENTLNIPVRLVNPSPVPVTIRKNTNVAQLNQLDSISINGVDVQCGSNDDPPLNVCPHTQQVLWDMVEQSDVNLSESQQQQLYSLLLGYSGVFATNNSNLGRASLLQHTIHTGDSLPIRQHTRRIPHYQRDEVKKLVQEMLAKNIIQPSTSPWASPVVIVRKKDGSARFCVDYRKLNNITRKDAFPLPRIDETLDTLSGAQWFSTLDLVSGYWQVEVAENDRAKTAFTTHEGLFEFRVMPFGLCNAPATFQRLMSLVLAGVEWSQCLVYLDDIIVLGRSFDEHLENLGIVLQKLKDANLRLKPAKYALCKTEVTYLGHKISREGVATDQAKVNKVENWPQPKTSQELQRFLGLASYYRKFIQNFASIARPLHRLTEKGRPFKWTSECTSAFCKLKQHLTTAPILVYPDFSRPFILDTDASNDGIGAVLSQEYDGSERVVAYASRTLNKSERKYSVTRKELLAVVVFTQHFRTYLLGQPFKLRTDHGSLSWLCNFKDPTGQLARWLEQLQEFHFEVIHRKGPAHQNADALSRLPHQAKEQHDFGPSASECENPDSVAIPQIAAASLQNNSAGSSDSTQPGDIREAQLADSITGPILRAKEAVPPQKLDSGMLRGADQKLHQLSSQWDQLTVLNGILYHTHESDDGKSTHLQLIVPVTLQAQILQEVHGGKSSGHLGEEKTLAKLRERFYWPGMTTSVHEWCQTCNSCMSRKGPQHARQGALENMKAGYPLEIMAMDIVGPLPTSKTGNKYILVISDYFTKWAEAIGIPNQEAITVATKLVDHVFCRLSIPTQLHSDMGAQFESQLIKDISALLGIKKTHTTPYHPQSDGLVERLNRTILEHVGYHHQGPWRRMGESSGKSVLCIQHQCAQIYRIYPILPFVWETGKDSN